MRYDLDLIRDLCNELGLPAQVDAGKCVDIDLGEGAILRFLNAEVEDDCRVGFLDTPWHTHGDFMFADARGNYVTLDYLDLLTALKEGRVLICEQRVENRVLDRWLVHQGYNDEFQYVQEGERIVVRRASSDAGGKDRFGANRTFPTYPPNSRS